MKNKKNWIYNKTVIITGASSGIGKDLTKILINKYSCKVIGIGRNKENMIKLSSEIISPDSFSYHLFDVSSYENWEKFANNIKNNNKEIDILINCAGILPQFKKFNDYSISEIEKVINTNFYSSIYSIKTLFDSLLKSKNSGIINISSSSSLCSIAGTSIYSASKSALKALTECISAEYKNQIYISLVCPGFTKTNIFREQVYKDKSKLINLASTSSLKIANKIIKGIKKKKRRMVLGKDAKFMDIFYRLMPQPTMKMVNGVLKKSKIKLFNDVYKFKQ